MRKVTFAERISVLLAIGAALVLASLLALWDVARHAHEVHKGWYYLPFAVKVPWYVAGDLFVTTGVAGLILVVLWGLLD